MFLNFPAFSPCYLFTFDLSPVESLSMESSSFRSGSALPLTSVLFFPFSSRLQGSSYPHPRLPKISLTTRPLSFPSPPLCARRVECSYPARSGSVPWSLMVSSNVHSPLSWSNVAHPTCQLSFFSVNFSAPLTGPLSYSGFRFFLTQRSRTFRLAFPPFPLLYFPRSLPCRIRKRPVHLPRR